MQEGIVTKRADRKRTQRVVVLMSPDEVRMIEDWMFAQRIKSLGDAVRRLSAAGLRVNREEGVNCHD